LPNSALELPILFSNEALSGDVFKVDYRTGSYVDEITRTKGNWV
jgi:hypothetical protein